MDIPGPVCYGAILAEDLSDAKVNAQQSYFGKEQEEGLDHYTIARDGFRQATTEIIEPTGYLQPRSEE
jgi:hypothetical protein